jgi:N-glycosylase/DNA lyase
MDYRVQNKDIILRQSDFDLSETLDCGQAFRWKQIETENGYDITYSGCYINKPLKISQKNDEFAFHDTTEEDFLNIWVDYFGRKLIIYTSRQPVYNRLMKKLGEPK